MKKFRNLRKIMIFAAMAAMLAAPLTLSGCGEAQGGEQQGGEQMVGGLCDYPVNPAASLMNGITAQAQSNAPLSDEAVEAYRKATAEFSADLFRKAYQPGENSLLSPISAGCALAMTANGANGNTETQFLSLLGGGMSQEQLNQAYSKLIETLRDRPNTGLLYLADSIWIRKDNGLAVKQDFLQTNADFFHADAYEMDFSDNETLRSINRWVSWNTDGKIQNMLEEPIDPDTMMYLINTLYFQMDWKTPFEGGTTQEREFHTADNQTVSAPFLYGKPDSAFYVKNARAQGIKKAYADDRYSFLAVLPAEGIPLDDYVSSLTGAEFLELSRQTEADPFPPYTAVSMSHPEGISPTPPSRTVTYQLPKFRYSYGKSLKNALISMGLSDAFTKDADFSGMAEDAQERGLRVGDVLQKTFIEVDELGTKAGAATVVEMNAEGVMEATYQLTFDRPFLYAVIENESGLPLFLGTVTNPTK